MNIKSVLKRPVLALLLKLAKFAKVAKIIKVALFGGTAVAYGAVYGWVVAALLMTCLTIHECGHLWAMRRKGFAIKGFYMIPFAGAMIIPERSFRSRAEESFIASMGPAAGALISLASAGLFMVTGNPLWAHIALFNTILNMFNLLPVNPLDGGRMAKSIIFSAAPQLKMAFKAFTGIMLIILLGFLVKGLIYSHSWVEVLIRSLNVTLWVFIILGSLIELAKDDDDEILPMSNGETYKALASYVGIIFMFVLATSMTWADPTIPEAIYHIIYE